MTTSANQPQGLAPVAAASPRADRRTWVGLVVIALACVLYAMDLTVLNLAVPRLSESLQPSSSQLLWIVDIYGFLVAGMLITMGTLGDRIGRRRLLMMGAATFGVASVFAAFAGSAGQLIVARAILGVAGATLAPSTLSLIRNMFLDPQQRTAAIGIWATSFSVGGAIGPLLGGVMLQHFWWGSVFLLAVPVMVLLLGLGPRLLPEYRDENAGRLDLGSAGLSLVAVLAVIFGIKRWAQDGFGTLPVASMVLGLVVGAAFVRRQGQLADPLIDLRLFRVSAFRVSLGTFLVTTLVVFGAYVYVGQYMQLVLGLSPLAAGLWLLPGSVCVTAGSLLAPAIVRRVHPAFVIGAGLGFSTIGFVVLTLVGHFGLAALVAGSCVLYVGLGPVFTLGTDLIVSAAPPERAGAAAAISETSSELGGALGIAILGSFGTALYRRAMATAALDGIPAAVRSAARDTLGGATAVAGKLPKDVADALTSVARAAFVHAFTATVGVCAVLAALTAIVAMTLLRRLPRAGAEAHAGSPQGPAQGSTKGAAEGISPEPLARSA